MIRRAARAAFGITIVALGIFALYERLEAPATQVFGATFVRGHGREVALTFDDGPNPDVTPGVLALLEREHVRATFFVVGRAARRHPALLRRMAADGDEIGNHTETHAHLDALFTRPALDRELQGARDAIVGATGRAPTTLRPPFGARDFAAVAEAHRLGYTVVMWTAMLEDRPPGSSAAAQADVLVRCAGDGGIVVLHDGDQGRDGRGGRTYEGREYTALVIAGLRARGYRFVTVDELMRAHA